MTNFAIAFGLVPLADIKGSVYSRLFLTLSKFGNSGQSKNATMNDAHRYVITFQLSCFSELQEFWCIHIGVRLSLLVETDTGDATCQIE